MRGGDEGRSSTWWLVGSLVWIVVALALVTAMLSRNPPPFVYQGF